MNLKKNKLCRLIVSFLMLLYMVAPYNALAGDISDDVDDAVDELQDIEDALNDLEEEIDGTYGATVATGDDDIGDSVTQVTNLKIEGGDETWTSGECVYVAAGATVAVGDTRVTACDTYLALSTVATGDTDIGTAVNTSSAGNLDITGGDASWASGEDVYVAAGATVAVGDTRVNRSTIQSLTALNSLFNSVQNYLDDAADELDDLKGESIPSDDLDDLEDALDDVQTAAEDVVDVIDDNKHTNLSDDFDDKEDDVNDDLDDLDNDMDDVRTGQDSDNRDVEDFVDNLGDIEDNVDDIRESIPSSITTSSSMQNYIDDLDDELTDAEDEVDDLDVDDFTSVEIQDMQDAWDDLATAFDDALNDLEDAVDEGGDNDTDDDFQDERDDLEDDIQSVEERLDSILAGDYDDGDNARDVENLVEDIDDYRDDIKDLNRIFNDSYGPTLETGDEDVGDAIVAATVYITGGDGDWVSGEKMYTKGTGVDLTHVEAGDYRITSYGDTYLAETTVVTGDSDIGVVFQVASDIYKNGTVYYLSDGSPLEVGDTRVTREYLMYQSELNDIFSDIEDITDDLEDDLRDMIGEGLSASEIEDIESAYNRFSDKVDDYLADIDDMVHDSLDDEYSDAEDDHDRNMEDLDTVMADIKEGTNTTVADRINDFIDNLGDIEDDISDIRIGITSTITTTTAVRDHFDDISDVMDDLEDEIDDLEGYSYSTVEKSRAEDAIDDVRSELEDTEDHIEDMLASDDDVENRFDDEKDDIDDEMVSYENDLALVLSGSNTASRQINDLIDDLKDYKDDLDDVYNDLLDLGDGSITERNDVRDYSDDIQDSLDDAIDALEDFDDDVTSLGVARIRSAVNNLEDKMNDAVDTLEDDLEADNDNLEDTFDEEKDDIDDKFDDVNTAAELIYDRAPEITTDDDEDEADEQDEDDTVNEELEEEIEDEDYTDIDFSDISSSNVFKDDIDALASLGIISGYSDGTFKPNNKVSRGEFLKIVTGAADIDLSAPSNAQSFSDVPTYHTFFPWIDYAKKMGYISGYSDGSFHPDDEISRFEATVIILRFLGASTASSPSGSQYFIDITSPSIAAYTDAAFEQRILSGYPDNTFRPDASITRGETAKIAVNAFS